VTDCTAGLQYETFSSHYYLQAAKECAIQAVASVLRVLPVEITGKLPAEHCQRLKDLADRIPVVGEPIPREDLWDVATGIFPRLRSTLVA